MHTMRIAGLAAAVLFAAACAGGISRQARSQVTYRGSFDELRQQPDRFRGETVLLGGAVLKTQVLSGRTELTLLQMPVEGSGRPADPDASRGRFILRAAGFLDPALYAPGTRVSVVGRVVGGRTLLIGRMPYLHLVVEPVEVRRWEPETRPYPIFHFGVGVHSTF